jgi:replicative DNA helicase
MAELRTKARRMKLEHDIRLVCVDYLQLMRSDQRAENRNQEISYISRSLKALARELNVPVLVLSQLSRAIEQRQDHVPMLSDLRDSGAVEQDADIVMFLSRSEDPETPNIVDLTIAKHRNGPTDKIPLFFRNELTRFADVEYWRVPLNV